MLLILVGLLKPTEYGLIGWADHLTLVSTNCSMTFENAGSSEMRRCLLSFFVIGIILAIIHLGGSLPSVNDWLMSLRKGFLVWTYGKSLLDGGPCHEH